MPKSEELYALFLEVKTVSHAMASWVTYLEERTRSQTEKGGSRKSKFMAESGIPVFVKILKDGIRRFRI